MAEQSIKRRQSNEPDRFTQLKQQGLADIIRLAGKRWTDYNLHDPGITLLEQLCFSLTELQYRCDFAIADLLTGADGRIDFAALGLVSPEQILSCRPTTTADYRRYMLDCLPQLAEFYLLPQATTGLYHAVAVARGADNDAAALIAKIRRCYSAQRNLGEQLTDIRLLTPLPCQPVAELDIAAAADPVELLAEFYYRCQQLLQRSTERCSYADLLAQGQSYEQLFDGPLTPDGVLLHSAPDYGQLQINDFFQPLQQIDGVVQLNRFYLQCEGRACYDSLPLQHNLPLYCLQAVQPGQPPAVRLLLGNKAIAVDMAAVMQRYQQKLFRQHSRWQTDLAALCPAPEGRYRPVGHYQSLQALLPRNYGLQRLPAQSSAVQLQLKGYLLLFEQLLANFLAQLQQLPALFSPFETGQSYYYQALDNRHIAGIESLQHGAMTTKLQQLYSRLDDVLARKHRLLDYLLALYGESLYQHSLQHFDYYHSAHSGSARRLQQKISYLQQIVCMTRDRVAAPDHYAPLWRDAVGGFVRKQALLLDLGQIAQSLTTAVLQHKLRLSRSSAQLQLLYLDETLADDLLQPVPALRLPFAADSPALRRRLSGACCFDGDTLPEQVVQSGVVLANYRITRHNGRYQLLLPVPDSRRDEWWLLGSYRHYRGALILANCLCQFLCHISQSSEGLHVIEHLLLQPEPTDTTDSLPLEFYNGRITVLCPGWTARFADRGFQQLVSETLQLNCPAHLSCQVIFINFKQMNYFERLFKYWRTAFKQQGHSSNAESRALAHYIYRLSHAQPAAAPEVADASTDAG